MKIIFSPTKTMKTKNHDLIQNTDIIFPDKTNDLLKRLSKLTINDIKKIMKTSDKLTKEIYNNYKYYNDNKTTPAILTYTGTTFKQLTIDQYNHSQIDYIEENLYILSAFYGILKPSTGIKPYRLDLTMNLLKDVSLTNYWKATISNYLKEEDIIINLASNEFSALVDHPNLITIDFLTKKNDKIKRIAMHAKKARGQLLDIMIKHNIKNIEQIKKISFDEYYFDETRSTNHLITFIK